MSGAPTAPGGAVVGTPRRAATRTTVVLLAAIAAACSTETAITGVGSTVASLTITAEADGPAGAPPAGGPIEMDVGESVSLSATGTNALGLAVSDVAASWSSSAPAVVEVGADGVATALSPGSADVSATAGDISASVRIVVRDSEVAAPAAP